MLAVTGAVVFIAEPAAAADPATNPSIARQCGLDMTLVLDASGSVNTANAVGAVRTAADDFLTAFQDTGSTARVLQFGTAAQQLAARGVVDNASMAAGGTFAQAVANYYNPIPPAPASRTFRQYNGSGNPALATSWGNANTSSNQYTNWDQAMKVTAQDSGDLVIFITDGDPTAYDLDQPGDPFDGNVIGYNTNRGLANAVTMDRSVTSANAVKANGSRILTVGVGSALQNAASQERLTQMSGPNVAKTTADFNIETTDVALVSNFDDLAAAVRSLVLDLCSPSLTIRKMAQTADNASFQPASGWDMTATPTVPGGFDWILPTNATGASSTVSTSDDGFAQFQWEPTEPDAVSSASVSEALKAGYTAGRPGANNDYECDFRDSDGNVRSVEGELSTANGSATFGIPEIYAEIGTCTVYNSFNYAPAIQITKSNDPTVVRGDLDPGAAVTSAYLVTNPGNTPLSNVTVTDDKCGPVQPVPATGANAGDADGDGMLDVGEQWQFTCTRAMTSSAGESEATTVTNTATVNGTDPAGTQVSDTADADVSLYVPGISLVKLVNGAKTTTVPVTDPLTSVTYSYTATNTGNTPLTGVQLSDDQQACANPTLTSDPNGNGVLDLGESWTYSCTTAPAESVVNIATVEATPVNPVTGDPFADPNPPVTATDHAAVTLIDPRLSLTKSVDRTVVFPGTEVTYTYVAENTGDAPLAKPDGQQDWITDSHCSPVAYDSSDTNGDGVIDPSES